MKDFFFKKKIEGEFLSPSRFSLDESWSKEKIHLSAYDYPTPYSFFILKKKSFFYEWQEMAKTQDYSKTVLVLEQKFWEKLSLEEQTFIQEKTCTVFLCTDLSKTLCLLSKVAFDQAEEFQCQKSIDGRQMGTTAISPSALISQNVFIGEHVTIGPHTVLYPGVIILGYCHIGGHCTLYPNTVIYPKTTLKEGVIIHANCTIGADGFGYEWDAKEGKHQKIWHVGGVVLENHVEVGANTTIDRATFGFTFIGEGSKIDNGVQIAHNCRLGKHVILCGHTALGGSVSIGDYTLVGGGVKIGPGISIGAKSQIAGASCVGEDCPASSVLSGYPARPLKEWIKGVKLWRRLIEEKEKEKEER